MIQLKVCFIGASAVGKTSLIRRYVDGIFSEKYLTTIGVKIDKKIVNIADDICQLMIWDLEGTDRFCGFQPRYLRGAAAYVIVIDHSRPTTFTDGLEILAQAQHHSDAPVFLVLNKSDLPCQLSVEQMEQLHQLDINSITNTSAKSGDKVDALFIQIAEYIQSKRLQHG